MKRTLLCTIIWLAALSVAFGQETAGNERLYSVPDINGRATVLVQPEISSDVSAAADGRTLTVKIVVDADGNVISAKCSLSCPKRTIEPAEAAAKASKFRPLIISGQAVKYDGILIYTLAVGKVNWYRFAGALQSTYTFDNLSLGPVAAMLTNQFSEERKKLQDLDSKVELEFRWKTIEDVKSSIRSKLQGKDVWWFDLGFAMRDVTAPFQSDKKLDLNEVQSAISNLAKFVETAPSDVPPQTVENLRTLSNYKIDQKLPLPKSLQAVFELVSTVRP